MRPLESVRVPNLAIQQQAPQASLLFADTGPT